MTIDWAILRHFRRDWRCVDWLSRKVLLVFNGRIAGISGILGGY